MHLNGFPLSWMSKTIQPFLFAKKLNLVTFCSNFIYPLLSVPLIVTEKIGFQPHGRLIFLLTLLTKLNSTQSYSALQLLKCLTELFVLFRQPTMILVSMRPFCIQSCPEILITVSPLTLHAVRFPLPALWTERSTTLTFYWFRCQISMVITVMEQYLTTLQWLRWLSR